MNKLGLLIAISVLALRAGAEEWKIVQTRGSVFVWDGQRTLRPARGELLPPARVLRLGLGAGLRLEGSAGSTLSALGPAQLRLETNARDLFLQYGDYRVKLAENSDLSVQWSRGHAEAPTEFYVELGTTPLVRVHAVNGPGVTTSRGRLSAGHSESDVGSVLRRSAVEPEEIERLRQRHESFRLARLEEENALVEKTTWDFRSAFEIRGMVGLSRLEPRRGSTFEQDTIVSGASARYLRNFFLSLPKRPERAHGLRAPRLRVGVEIANISGALRPKAGFELAPALIDANLLLGYGGLGLFGDLLVGGGYAKVGSYRPPALRWGLEAGYRWDIKNVLQTETETGLLFSFFWSPNPMTLSGNPVRDVSPATFTWHVLALRVGLSFLF